VDSYHLDQSLKWSFPPPHFQLPRLRIISMKRISDYERALDYFMSASMAEAQLAYQTVGRILKNRVVSQTPEPQPKAGAPKKASKKRGAYKPKPAPAEALSDERKKEALSKAGVGGGLAASSSVAGSGGD
jgi:hypothetical protein